MTIASPQSASVPRPRRPVRTRRLVLRLAAAVSACWTLSLHGATPAADPPREPQPVAQADPRGASDAPTPPVFTREQQETFLREARVTRRRSAPKGITGSHRVTLSDGVHTHDAHVQTIDESKREFQTARGTELNFRDTWRHNVAAYRLSVLLGLDMVPVTVERRFEQKPASFTWWVDDVMMDEAARVQKKVRVPDPRAWNQQMYVVRVFDQLIFNTDRNLGNLLITSDWRVWMIDHTRAFRLFRHLRAEKDLRGCDRTLLARLEALDADTLDRELADYLERSERQALLARRDRLVEILRADPSLHFDLPPSMLIALRPEP